MMTTLGRLEKIDLRQEWPTEAQDFTPWLAQEENLALLGETLGLDLELEAVEQNVGPFRADILCKDTLSDRWVLIENQLERTDHTHLGQLITYAAGLEAVTIVWIASRFTEEHRAAMDWLNEITDTEARFFALEVELWCIGDSLAAPKFNVASSPNEWSRSTTAAKKVVADRNVTPTQQMQREYWQTVENIIAEARGPLKPVTPQPTQWISHGLGKSGVTVNFATNQNSKLIRAEVYLAGKLAKSNYSKLIEERTTIDKELGYPLQWQEMKHEAKIFVALKNADPTNREDWPRQHAWLVDNGSKLYNVFRPLIMQLNHADPKDEFQ